MANYVDVFYPNNVCRLWLVIDYVEEFGWDVFRIAEHVLGTPPRWARSFSWPDEWGIPYRSDELFDFMLRNGIGPGQPFLLEISYRCIRCPATPNSAEEWDDVVEWSVISKEEPGTSTRCHDL